MAHHTKNHKGALMGPFYDKRDRGIGQLVTLALLVAVLTACFTSTSVAAESEISMTPSTTNPYYACPNGACNAIIEPPAVKTESRFALPGSEVLLEGSGEKGGYDPEDLRSAYKYPENGGSGQTVAVVDAYGDETAESDLNVYRKRYGLSECTKAKGCFKQVNQNGEEKGLPNPGPAGWGVETSLDLDMVSAACPNCNILLVEASGELAPETGASVNAAANLHATEISNSYGYPENYEPWCGKTGCSQYASDYDHPGIPVLASSGDSGYRDAGRGVSFPASAPTVVAVGGTSLKKLTKASRGWTEAVWYESFRGAGTGGGCSEFESKPEWQTDLGCADRTTNDVSAVAACETPLSVYSTPHFEGEAAGWTDICGTSASSPLVAGIMAHATTYTRTLGAHTFYTSGVKLFDVTVGHNGECGSSYLCTAEIGYDGPTGEGTPDGVPVGTGTPLATTSLASAIKVTAATLNGTVTPGDLETVYHFEYGPTTSYGTKTPEIKAGSGGETLEESMRITGLKAGSAYHMRIVAKNSAGTTGGTDEVFNTEPEIIEYALPEKSDPTGITAGPDGNIWFVEGTASKIGKITTSGTVTEYSLPAGSHPWEIAPGPNGEKALWFTEWGKGRIGKITTSGTVTEYSLPSEKSAPEGIATGPDGNMWFAAPGSDVIGKITPSGTITEYAVNAALRIVAGPDGNMWFTNPVYSKIGKMTTSGVITEYSLPSGSEPVAITVGPDNNLWFENQGTVKIGKMTTSGVITEYSVPNNGEPYEKSFYGLAAGPDGNVWFAYEGTNKIGKMTTSGAVTEYSLPARSYPSNITAGPDKNIWFTNSGTSKIGKVVLP
jgi:streptogramin lyase